MHHLFIRAIDRLGRYSDISDVVFLLDRTPPVVEGDLIKLSPAQSNGTALGVTMKYNGGAPVDLESFAVHFKDQVLPLNGPFTELHSNTNGLRQTAQLNYPYLLREALRNSKDGDSLELTIGRVTDGAGNASRPLKVNLMVDHKSDQRPPTWIEPDLNPGFAKTFSLAGIENGLPTMQAGRSQDVDSVHSLTEPPFLRHHVTKDGRGLLRGSVRSRPNRHPLVGMRIRLEHTGEKEKPVNLSLVVLTKKRKHSLAIPLSGKAVHAELKKDPMVARLPEPYSFVPGQWTHITVDIEKLYRRFFDEDEIKNIVIVNLQLVRDAKTKSYLDVEQLALFSPNADRHEIVLDAYDASGVSHMSWTYHDADGKEIESGDLPFPVLKLEDLKVKYQLELKDLQSRNRDLAERLARAVLDGGLPG